jgi:hypothetical protein
VGGFFSSTIQRSGFPDAGECVHLQIATYLFDRSEVGTPEDGHPRSDCAPGAQLLGSETM